MQFTTELRAFHGTAETKNDYLARVRAHAAADEIVQGVYWERGRGCAVGCTVHSSDHAAYERELGIPRLIAYLEDTLFERMEFKDAKGWPERFLNAIPVGADLSMVYPRFAIWMLTDPTDGVIRFAKHDDVKQAITRVAELYQLTIDGAEVDVETWCAVRREAWAARDAAWSRRRRAEVVEAVAVAAEAAAAEVEAVAVAAAAAVVVAVEAEAVEAEAVAVEAVAAAAVVGYYGRAYNSARRAYALRASSKLLEILESSPVPAGV